MKVLGIIPARKGSKSIPNKNRVRLNGKPLIQYTFNAVNKSKLLSRCIISTDDAAILKLAQKNKIEVPFMRPRSLSGDKTPMIRVVRHALQFLKKKEKYIPDAVIILQPTSPLRTFKHIDRAIALLQRTDADSVVSVVEVPHQFTPISLMKLKRERLVSAAKGKSILRRQDKPKLYARNGPAIVVARQEFILKTNSLFGGNCRPLMMNSRESVDIDEPKDLELAFFYLSRR